uniref:Uncharacterized protein n=1 Tax=Arion vulgaris TaxID=1028688 RepID=A0A0B6Z4C4_9EUPU
MTRLYARIKVWSSILIKPFWQHVNTNNVVDDMCTVSGLYSLPDLGRNQIKENNENLAVMSVCSTFLRFPILLMCPCNVPNSTVLLPDMIKKVKQFGLQILTQC